MAAPNAPGPRGRPSSLLATIVVGAGALGSLLFAYAKMSRSGEALVLPEVSRSAAPAAGSAASSTSKRPAPTPSADAGADLDAGARDAEAR